MTSKVYPYHPACELLPMIGPADLEELTRSIKELGLLDPIRLLDGQIIDGRSRYIACFQSGVEPVYQDVKIKGDVVDWVMAKNLARRHLTIGEKAKLGVKIKEYHAKAAAERERAGTTLASADARGKASKHAAKQLHISPATIERAEKVIHKGTPELAEQMAQGKVSVTAAARIADKPKAEQRKAVAAIERGAKPPKPSKNGHAVGDFSKLVELLGKAARAADDVNNTKPGGKFHREVLAGIEQCHKAVKEWQRATRGA